MPGVDLFGPLTYTTLGEEALVLHSGYFGDSFADWYNSPYALIDSSLIHTSLETYGAKVRQIKAPVGAAVQVDEIKSALQEKKYKIVTVTHVDTSTGVLSDIKAVANAVKEVSPDTLVYMTYDKANSYSKFGQ